MAEKTSISLDRETLDTAQNFRKEASGILGRNVKWDAIVYGFCDVAENHPDEFMNKVDERSKMARLKCTICGEMMGSIKEVEKHFQTVHQTREAFTIIE